MSMIKRNFITVVSSPVKEKRKFNGRCILTPFINPEAGKPRPESVIEYAEDYIDTVKENASSYPCEFIKEGNPCKVYLDIDYKIEASKCSHHKGRDGLDHYTYTGNDKVNVRKEIDKIPLFKDQDFNIITRKERKIIKKDEEFVKFSYHIVFSNLYTKDVKNIKEYLKGLGYEDDKPFDLGVYNKNQGMNGLFCKKPIKRGIDEDIQSLGGDDYDNYKPIEKYLITVVPDDANFVEWDKWIIKKEEEVKKEVKKDNNISVFDYDDDNIDYDNDEPNDVKVKKLKDLLTLIDPVKEYTLWIKHIMGIKSILKHDLELAYNIAVEWSKYTDGEFPSQWKGIRNLNRVTWGSLRRSAEIENPVGYTEFRKKWDMPKYIRIQDDDDITIYNDDGYGNKTYEELRKEFNKTCGLIKYPLCFVSEEGNFYNESKFKSLYGDKWYVNEKGKYKKFITKWLGDPNRKKYNTICFNPDMKSTGKDYNMFKGFTYTNIVKNNSEDNKLYEETDISPYLDHIKNVICSGNNDEYEFILRWMANIVQRPWKKSGVVILLRGKQGIGKNLFTDAYADLFVYNENNQKTRYKMITAKPERDIFGRFCVNLQKRLLVIIQEAKGLHPYSEEFKDLITGYDIQLEKKGEDDDVERKNYLNFMITTNNYNSTLVSPDDRRFFVPTIDNTKKDIGYYQNVAMTIKEQGFLPTLMKYLLDYKVDEEENLQSTRPITRGFIEMRNANYNSVDMFLLDKSFRDEIKYNKNKQYVPYTSKLFTEYKTFCSKNNYDKVFDKKHFEQHFLHNGYQIRIKNKQNAVVFSEAKYEEFYKNNISDKVVEIVDGDDINYNSDDEE